MGIKQVTYEITGVWNHNNTGLQEKITVTADIPEGKTLQEAVEELRNRSIEGLKFYPQIYRNTLENINKAQQEYEKIRTAIEGAKKHWETTTEFFKAQGIKNDFADFPSIDMKQLPPVGEIIDSDY